MQLIDILHFALIFWDFGFRRNACSLNSARRGPESSGNQITSGDTILCHSISAKNLSRRGRKSQRGKPVVRLW